MTVFTPVIREPGPYRPADAARRRLLLVAIVVVVALAALASAARVGGDAPGITLDASTVSGAGALTGLPLEPPVVPFPDVDVHPPAVPGPGR